MLRALLLTVLALSTLGCVSLNTPITGLLYNDSKGPSSVGTGEGGAKSGIACSKGVLGFVWGDASIEAAKAQGGIAKVAHVDHKVTSVLAVYAEYCTIVRGD
jgi:hypothetical protein